MLMYYLFPALTKTCQQLPLLSVVSPIISINIKSITTHKYDPANLCVLFSISLHSKQLKRGLVIFISMCVCV